MNARSDRDLIATQLDDLDAAWDTFIGVRARDPGHDQLAPLIAEVRARAAEVYNLIVGDDDWTRP